MTMDEEKEDIFSSMALPVILQPVLESLEEKDTAVAQTLMASLEKVENQHPGFCYDLLKIVINRAGIQNEIQWSECYLRLEAVNTSTDLHSNRSEVEFRNFNKAAVALKKILSKIPDEISDRKKFLDTIKDIANAIKSLLDAVNIVTQCYIKDQAADKQQVEQRKREFVRYSKKFSTTLKDFFRENEKTKVYVSANFLIHQTNLIMKIVKEVC